MFGNDRGIVTRLGIPTLLGLVLCLNPLYAGPDAVTDFQSAFEGYIQAWTAALTSGAQVFKRDYPVVTVNPRGQNNNFNGGFGNSGFGNGGFGNGGFGSNGFGNGFGNNGFGNGFGNNGFGGGGFSTPGNFLRNGSRKLVDPTKAQEAFGIVESGINAFTQSNITTPTSDPTTQPVNQFVTYLQTSWNSAKLDPGALQSLQTNLTNVGKWADDLPKAATQSGDHPVGAADTGGTSGKSSLDALQAAFPEGERIVMRDFSDKVSDLDRANDRARDQAENLANNSNRNAANRPMGGGGGGGGGGKPGGGSGAGSGAGGDKGKSNDDQKDSNQFKGITNALENLKGPKENQFDPSEYSKDGDKPPKNNASEPINPITVSGGTSPLADTSKSSNPKAPKDKDDKLVIGGGTQTLTKSLGFNENGSSNKNPGSNSTAGGAPYRGGGSGAGSGPKPGGVNVSDDPYPQNGIIPNEKRMKYVMNRGGASGEGSGGEGNEVALASTVDGGGSADGMRFVGNPMAYDILPAVKGKLQGVLAYIGIVRQVCLSPSRFIVGLCLKRMAPEKARVDPTIAGREKARNDLKNELISSLKYR